MIVAVAFALLSPLVSATLIHEPRDASLQQQLRGAALDAVGNELEDLPVHGVGSEDCFNRTDWDFTWGRYSQLGQDEWVLETYNTLPSVKVVPVSSTHGLAKAPFFLDLGAHDGKHLSNTKLLEEHGWHGLCVEPFPHHFETRTCALARRVIGLEAGLKVDMFTCPAEMGVFNGIASHDATEAKERLHEACVEKHCQKVQKQTTTVDKVLWEHRNIVPAVIDYVSLDIEGEELAVIEKFPFKQHCARMWTIEHNEEEPKKSNIISALASRGCKVEKEVGVESWFVCDCSGY